MAKPCFFHAELTEQTQQNEVIELSVSESAHALQSRRLIVGTDIHLINGCGVLAGAHIDEVKKRQVFVRIDAVKAPEIPRLELNMAVAMPKGDKQKQLVDMLTQIGATSLIPMVTEFAVSVPKSSQLDKLRRVTIEACKQSHNPWALNIVAPTEFKQLVGRNMTMFYADQHGLPLEKAREITSDCNNAMVFIGPEGGFSEKEKQALNESGAQSLALGQHILRTETAAIAAAAMFKC